MLELSKQLKGSFENVLRVGSQSRFGNVVERDILASFFAAELPCRTGDTENEPQGIC